MNARIKVLVPLLALALFGCSSSDGDPTAPSSGGDDGGGEEIRQPRYARIESVRVGTFPGRQGDAPWDATISVEGRAPDVYATLQVGSSAAFYRSRTKDDAEWNLSHDMSTALSGGTPLPRAVGTASQLTVSAFDEDGVSGDDFMGAVSTLVGSRYADDNAETFSWVFTGSGEVVFRVAGTWVY